jgi:signal transduction histidine kinase
MMIYPLKGKNRHFEVTASPLRDPDGTPSSILLVKRDVTLEKEYQAKYYHAEKMATIGLLAAGVAHEINNPLTAISGFAEGLRRRLPKLQGCFDTMAGGSNLREDFQEYLETILNECNRCRDIVSRLLTFSPREKVEFYPIDLNQLIVNVLKLLRHHLKSKPPDFIQLDLAASLPPIKGAAAELKQVILNLVLNALDATQNEGDITLRTWKRTDGHVILAVEDSGCGIPPERMHKLFEPFFTTKPVGQGIGIGLSTCYNIIKQHGGEITVTSEEGKGTTFFVKLPQFSSA